MEYGRFVIFGGCVYLLLCACLSAQIKNIVFDVDNVIVRSIKGAPKGADTQSQIIWKKLKSSDLREKWKKGLITAEDVQAALENAFPRHKKEVAKLLAYHIMRPRLVIEETGNIIKELKRLGYKLYVISNTTKERYQNGIAKIPLFKLFDGMTLSYEVHSHKPESKIFTAFLKQYAVDPSESVFIDDKEENVDVAKRVGMLGVVYRSGTFAEELRKVGVRL